MLLINGSSSSFICFSLSEGRGVESGSQRDQKPLLREQGGAEGDAGQGQAEGAGDHALVQPHRRDLPLQVVGQPAQPEAVHGSQQHPPHVTAKQRSRLQLLPLLSKPRRLLLQQQSRTDVEEREHHRLLLSL